MIKNVRVLLYHILRVYNLKSALTRIVWCVKFSSLFFGQLLVFEFYIDEMKFILILISHLIFQRQAYGERKFKILRRLPSQERRTKQGELKFSWWLRFSNSGFRNGCSKLYFTVGVEKILATEQKNVLIPVGTGNYRNKHCWTGVLVYYWMSLMLKNSFFLRGQVVDANVWYMAHMIKRYVNFAQIS